MTPKEISQFDSKMRSECFINNKTGIAYYVLDVAMDVTNARKGSPVVIYTTPGFRSTVFVRDLEEFNEKFTEKKGK